MNTATIRIPEEKKNLLKAIISVLKLQTSTKERISLLPTFYKRIFQITGKPSSVVDHACGLNPLTLFWMDLPAGCRYRAYDIDSAQIDFINNLLAGLIKDGFLRPGQLPALPHRAPDK